MINSLYNNIIKKYLPWYNNKTKLFAVDTYWYDTLNNDSSKQKTNNLIIFPQSTTKTNYFKRTTELR